ncbi:MAG TPA: ferritin-like domain-containing protein [Gemmatimonadota bacterium]|nr:ferritin-like domain-containing protein [Gemmatimonadota bacterium]
MEAQSFHDLFVDQLKDIYNAEKQITEALPKMVEAANDEKLREALEHHLEETHGQIDRLDRIFEELGVPAQGKTCKAMQGLIQEGEEALEKTGGPLGDVLLIAGAQRVEHYEIAAYGTARAWAEELGLDDAADLLDETLDEESAANEKLTSIAEGGLLSEGVNAEAKAGRE